MISNRKLDTKKLDRLVQTLYLAKSNNREEMLKSYVKTTLYNWNETASYKDIFELIQYDFHVKPSDYELNEAVRSLIQENCISNKNGQYNLKEDCRYHILKSIKVNENSEDERKDNFYKVVDDIAETNLTNAEKKILWIIFREYIYECFLQHGREAIKLFTFGDDKEDLTPEKILATSLINIQDKNLRNIFLKIVQEYPNYIKVNDIDYLEEIANRAENFFSLGLSKEEYEKLDALQFQSLVLLVDTNFLYSILELRDNPEDDACFQIINLAKAKEIDIRICYLPITIRELKAIKSDLETTIIEDRLTPTMIKALLTSENLDPFARKYYQNKIINSETYHPKYKVEYANTIFKTLNIESYNMQFPHLEDDEGFLNAKCTQYYDYLRIIQEARIEKGLEPKNEKSEKQVKHDIYLREAILEMRRGKISFNEIKTFGLTLDKVLIRYDNYDIGKNAVNKPDKSNAPSFFLPSIFLRKIRPFLTLVTDDYRKAFYRAVSTTTMRSGSRDNSLTIQQSFSFFKQLGISNFDTIISIIKEDVFLEEFKKSQKKEEGIEFIKSKLDETLDKITTEKANLEKGKQNLEKNLLSKEKQISETENNLSTTKNDLTDATYQISMFDKIIKELKEKENEKEEKLKEVQSNLAKVKIESKKELLNTKKDALVNTNNFLGKAIKQKARLDARVDRSIENLRYILLIAGILYYLVLIVLIVFLGWDIMEPFTFIFGFLPLILGFGYLVIKGKGFSYEQAIITIEKQIRDNIYRKNNFEINDFEEMKHLQSRLKSEIEKLESN